MKFLCKFYVANVEFSESYYPNVANVLIHIAKISYLLYQLKSKDSYREAIEIMIAKSKKCFYPISLIYLIIGVVSNPSNKMIETQNLIRCLYTYMDIGPTETLCVMTCMATLTHIRNNNTIIMQI